MVDAGLRHLSPSCRSDHVELLGVEALCRIQTDDIAEAHAVGARAEAALGTHAVGGDEGAVRLRADVARVVLWKARRGWTDLEAAITGARTVLEASTAPLSIARTGATLLELAAAETWQGDLDAAGRHARESLVMARSLGYDALVVQALGQCALQDAAQGATQSALVQATECLHRAATSGTGDAASASRARMALAWAELQALDVDRAAADLELSLPPTGPADPLVAVMGSVLRARLLIEDGRLPEAERALAVPVAVPDPVPGFAQALVGTTRAQLAAATGDDDGLDETIAALHGVGAVAEARLFSAIRTAFEGRVTEAVADLDDLTRHACPNLVTRSAAEVVRLTLLLLVGEAAAGRAHLPHLLTTVATHRHLYVLTAALRAGDVFLEVLDHESRRTDAHPYAAEALAAMRSYQLAYTDRRRPLLDASRTTAPGARRRPAGSPDDAAVPPLLTALTPREAEVFEQLALGGSYSDIGRALYVTENTVKTHLAAVYRKLGVERRAEALQVGRDRGLLGSAPQRRPPQ